MPTLGPPVPARPRPAHGQPIVAGGNSSWLVQVPRRCSSWTAPWRMRRARPGEQLNLVAAEQICSWLALPPPARPLVRGTLLRREVDHLPRPPKPPVALWFWFWFWFWFWWGWWGGPVPPDRAEVWQASVARSSIEHPCRFFQQTLQWTTPQLRRPAAADRWTARLLLAFVPLRCAADQVADVCLPCQR